MGRDTSTRSSCPKPCSTWLWTLPMMGHEWWRTVTSCIKINRYVLVNHSGHIISNNCMKGIFWSSLLFFSFFLCLTAPLLHSVELNYARLHCLSHQKVFQTLLQQYGAMLPKRVLAIWMLLEGMEDPEEIKAPRLKILLVLVGQTFSLWSLPFPEIIKTE